PLAAWGRYPPTEGGFWRPHDAGGAPPPLHETYSLTVNFCRQMHRRKPPKRLRYASAYIRYMPAPPMELFQLDGLEIRRQDDLQQLAVVRIVEHRVLDPGRLQPARAFAHRHHAGALVLALDPALEHVDHLEVDVMVVALGHFCRIARWNHPDHVRLREAVGGGRDAEVAIFRVAPQSLLEIGLVEMRGDEGLPARALRLGSHLGSHLGSRLGSRLGRRRDGSPRRGFARRCARSRLA